jgi:hypothetical protein
MVGTSRSRMTLAEIGRPGSLHLAFFAVKTLIYRALMYPASSASKADPTSALSQTLPEALSQSRSFVDCVAKIREEDLKAFWGRRKCFPETSLYQT